MPTERSIYRLSFEMLKVNAILSEDPFYKEKIASYEIIEFIPTKYAQLVSKILFNKNEKGAISLHSLHYFMTLLI